jgi:hypothetical protein
VFDRGAVLREELERVLTRLSERHDPERVFGFGSPGRAPVAEAERWLEFAEDLALADATGIVAEVRRRMGGRP